jgi:creatinine amidohydrolase
MGRRGTAPIIVAMPVYQFATMTWPEVEQLDRERTIPLLPIGAIEAHGPHLPLNTDVIIAEAMVNAAASRLADAGLLPLVLPPVMYTAAAFAAGFPGTISPTPGAVRGTVAGIGRSLGRHGFRWLALANSHLDPVHLASLRAAIDVVDDDAIEIIFPDITRKPWALRLTDEFKSGACHAGQYESSIVMAARPELVREDVRSGLDDVTASLSDAIKVGKTSFESAGGPQAYFGYPAQASAAEGVATVAILGEILADAIQAALAQPAEGPN